MTSKLLTPKQDKTRVKLAFDAGLKGAAMGLGLGIIATALTLRRSPEFRALSRPIQSIMAVSGSGAGFMFEADRVSSAYENRHLGYTDEIMLQDLMKRERKPQLTTKESVLHYLNDNRWTFIGASWAISMVGALGISFSNRYLSTQQKIVQARMYAQAVTLAVLMTSAGVSIYIGEDENKKREEPNPQLTAILALPHTSAKDSSS
ncbi:hypothetical protein BDF14DRAFT_1822141 [Spinellus fusiger]|nr:hypothetical protein BDF14DRAFT_1822141 [Spinellus fusiger]